MPKKDSILSLPGFAITKTLSQKPLVLEVSYRRKHAVPIARRPRSGAKRVFCAAYAMKSLACGQQPFNLLLINFIALAVKNILINALKALLNINVPLNDYTNKSLFNIPKDMLLPHKSPRG